MRHSVLGEGKKRLWGGREGQRTETWNVYSSEWRWCNCKTVFGDFWYEEMSEFLTLWTGSVVSSCNLPAWGGWSCTWTRLSPVLLKFRIRFTAPPGLLVSLTTMTGGFLALQLCGPMLFMISYPSSNCFSLWPAGFSGRYDGQLFPAVFNLFSSRVRSDGCWNE